MSDWKLGIDMIKPLSLPFIQLAAALTAGLIGSSAFAKFSANDIVAKIDANQITFKRGAIYSVPEAVKERMIQIEMARYPEFRPSMYYYHYVEVDGIGYYISYDWTAKECNLTWIDLKKAEGQKGAPQVKQSGSNIIDENKQTLPSRVCEKLYNFYQK